MEFEFYEYENEYGCVISIDNFREILYSTSTQTNLPQVRIYDMKQISQIWFDAQDLADGKVSKRSRIRTTVNAMGDHKDRGYNDIEYTTKYYFGKKRIELNSKLTIEEYLNLTKIVYKDIKPENKTRIFFEDTDTGLKYIADVPENSDKVRIEIEFANKEDMKNFIIPPWLNKYGYISTNA